MKRRLVLFDIDGTLLLSGGAGRRAILAAVAEEVGPAEGLERVRFDGKTDPQIVAELLAAAGRPQPPDAGLVEAVLTRYVAHLERDLAVNAHRAEVMPGVPGLIAALEREPVVVLGLLTGNVAPGAALKLRAVRLDPERFLVGAYGSDHAVRAALPPIAARRAEPHFGRVPRGEEVVIIGDTPDDVRCGQGIRARAIAVATGSYATEELRAAGAYAVFPDLGDTAAVCEAILE